VRIVFFVGWALEPLGFQLGHFSQYISLFVFGLIAYKSNWLNTIPLRTGKQLARLVLFLSPFFVIFYLIKEKFKTEEGWFSGGWHWESLLYAVWEQVIGFSIITALVVYGREYWNKSSAFLAKLSRYTFGVYIFHPLILISLTLAVRNWGIDPAVKLLIIGPLAVVGSFIFSAVITSIPGVKKII
jgi:surface polysaccharide O-acyltransferase-like enzyme